MFHSPGAIAFGPLPFLGLSLTVRWYGILMASAMALGLWLAYREARRRGIDPDDLLKASELGLLGGLIGARWRGLPAITYLDIAAPSLALGQAIGRWGNFFNEEAFGTPTDLPWRLYISPQHRPPQYAQEEFFHPTFLYESLWDLLVFVLLIGFFRTRLERAPGALFLTYLGLYSVGRFITEALRTDALMLGPIRVAQLASVVGVALALVGVPLLLRRVRATA